MRPATVRPLSIVAHDRANDTITDLTDLVDTAARRAGTKFDDALAEAERLWRASIDTAAHQPAPQDRLDAIERARYVAFSLLCDLTVDGPAGPTAS